jgi:hypothetical protein
VQIVYARFGGHKLCSCSMMASPITGSRESEAFCNFDSLRKEILRLLKVGLIRLVSENKINGEREINGELA